jgi:hypothetical protein
MVDVRSMAAASAWLAGMGLAGCAALACTPMTIVVAQKEERGRVGNVSQGLYRDTGTERLEPVQSPGVVRDYWVRSERGEWYRVNADQFTAAEVDHPLELCR